jgi:hypothetical protein
VHGVEILAQRGFDGIDGFQQAVGASSFNLRSSDWLRSRKTSTWRSTRLMVAPASRTCGRRSFMSSGVLRSKKSG